MPYCWCNPKKMVYPNGAMHLIHNETEGTDFLAERIERIEDMIAEPTDLPEVIIYNTAIKDVLSVLKGELD